jgi:hypothetical protein
MKKLSRRAMLRGTAGAGVVSIALPPLEAMLNGNGTAYAASPFPQRFGVWYYGCGITGHSAPLAVENFFPKTPGASWDPPRLLQPLAANKSYVTVVGGTQWAIAENTPHHVSRTAPVSGSYNLANVGNGGKMGPAFDPAGPSIDRVVAEAWKGKAPVDSVEMAVSRVGKYEGMISFLPGQLFPGEFDPANVFHRLFGNGVPKAALAGSPPPGGQPVEPNKAVLARKSVLDVVLADADDLKRRLGKADGVRVDAHLAGVRDIEHQLDVLLVNGSMPGSQSVGAGCALPAAPTAAPYDMLKEDFAGVHKVFADLLVMALTCDLTRVFSLEFTGAQCNSLMWPVGVMKAFHDYTHGGSEPDVDMLNMAEFSLKQFAYLVDRLKNTPQGAGNLLDSMAIYCVNEYLNSTSHSMKNGNHPILVVGKANGALNAGQFIKPASTENASRVGLAVLHALGVMAPSFGVLAGMATEPLPGILS